MSRVIYKGTQYRLQSCQMVRKVQKMYQESLLNVMRCLQKYAVPREKLPNGSRYTRGENSSEKGVFRYVTISGIVGFSSMLKKFVRFCVVYTDL